MSIVFVICASPCCRIVSYLRAVDDGHGHSSILKTVIKMLVTMLSMLCSDVHDAEDRCRFVEDDGALFFLRGAVL